MRCGKFRATNAAMSDDLESFRRQCEQEELRKLRDQRALWMVIALSLGFLLICNLVYGA